MKIKTDTNNDISKEVRTEIVSTSADNWFKDGDLKQSNFYNRVLNEILFRTEGQMTEDFESDDDIITTIEDQARACIDYMLWKGLEALENEMDDGEIFAYM